MGKLITLFLLFLYIFNISFVFLPSFLTTRILIGFFGFFIFLVSNKTISKPFLTLIGIFLLFLIPISITTVINDHFDNRFFGYIFQNIILLFGAYYIIKRIKNGRLFHCILITVFFHNLIAVCMFNNDSLFYFINSLQHLSENQVVNQVYEYKSRLIGIGWGNFFFGGVIGSAALLINVFLYLEQPKKHLIFTYFFLAITSIYIARIAYVGVLLSVFYVLVYYFKIDKSKFIKVFFFISFFLIICLGILINYINSSQSSSFRHSFEMFINFYENGTFETSSTNGVKEMLKFPDELKGILIGDGKFTNSDASYYQNTDVGYSRLAYYFGLPSILLYFMPTFYILYRLKYSNILFVIFKFFLLMLLIISNFKGLVDINWLLFLLFWNYENFIHNKRLSNWWC